MGDSVGVKGEERECEKLREMLDWMKAVKSKSVRDKSKERRREIREDWENRVRREMM